MSRLRVLSSREVCRILTLNGFEEDRRRGSHIVMKQRRLDNSGVYKTTTVIVPNRKQLKRGTLAGIIRQSGLPKDLFSS